LDCVHFFFVTLFLRHGWKCEYCTCAHDERELD